MNIKQINQNSDRYTNESTQWKISASKDIKPIYLPIGVNPLNLLPVLEVDGVIVEVGEYKLISQTTLNNIKDSNNPHYNLNENGVVKGVSIGKTIPTLRINLDSLQSLSEERDIVNRNASVNSVQYIFQGETIPNTNLSLNLVKQINYTLNPNVDRPKDTYNLTELQLAPLDVYDIRTETALNNQDLNNNIFSYSKLETYLNSVKETQMGLQKDFSLIKEVFWEGKLPADLNTYKITKMATAEDKLEEGDIQIVYKNSQPILNISPKAPENENVQLPKIPTSDLKIYVVAGKKNNRVLVYEKDPSTGNGGQVKYKFFSGKRFVGSFHKNYNNQQIYKVWDNNTSTLLLGYGISDETNGIFEDT
jgi:hypothetical protein